MKKYRALIISAGPVPPNEEESLDRIVQLYPVVSGIVLQPVWRDLDENGRQRTHYKRSGFDYICIHSTWMPGPLKLIADMTFFVVSGVWQHYFKSRFEVVISYGLIRTGLSAWLISLLTGTPLIVEVPGRPTDAHLADKLDPSKIDRLKNLITIYWARFLLSKVAMVRLFYQAQLDDFMNLGKINKSSFPDYVPLASFEGLNEDKDYILFLGFPWILKGVDCIISAFREVEDQIPQFKLKIVGHCPDRGPFEKLAAGSSQIEFCPAVSYQEAIKLIRECSFMVLASRTEAMPRVIVEAMAAKKPFIATKVGGIPEYTTNGVEGFHFEVGDRKSLARLIIKLAQDEQLRKQMGLKGHEKVESLWSERAHTELFRAMIAEVVDRSKQ